jgi:hypothetical protein
MSTRNGVSSIVLKEIKANNRGKRTLQHDKEKTRLG